MAIIWYLAAPIKVSVDRPYKLIESMQELLVDFDDFSTICSAAPAAIPQVVVPAALADPRVNLRTISNDLGHSSAIRWRRKANNCDDNSHFSETPISTRSAFADSRSTASTGEWSSTMRNCTGDA